jgi:tetratricopeptide (TPR) repeat protein
VAAIKRHLGDGDVAGARALIPELVDPQQTYSMLASNRYRPLWPDLEKWAGPKMARQWELYLTEARSRWSASHAPDAAGAYLDALLSAGRYSDVAKDLLPIFLSNLDKNEDYDLIFDVARVARALGELGRWNDVRALYALAEQTWPLGKDINALNITGNEARYLLYMGEPTRALDLIDRTIAEANRKPESINPDAVVGMHRVRTCILHELGRSAEAGTSLVIAAEDGDTQSAVELRLCIGDLAGAREALLRALADESHRDAAIALLQRDGTPLPKSAFELRLRKGWDNLRADRKLLAELAKYGRVLPFTLNEAARFAVKPNAPGTEPAPITPVT